MSQSPQITAGIDFPIKHIMGYYMLVRNFVPLTSIDINDKVGNAIMGAYGMVHAELPNPDVDESQRLLCIPIKNKSDFKSLQTGYNDKNVQSGDNELVLLYQQRNTFLSAPKASIHLAIYPTGTWLRYFAAVSDYASKEFKWGKPYVKFQPSSINVFPETTNIFRR